MNALERKAAAKKWLTPESVKPTTESKHPRARRLGAGVLSCIGTNLVTAGLFSPAMPLVLGLGAGAAAYGASRKFGLPAYAAKAEYKKSVETNTLSQRAARIGKSALGAQVIVLGLELALMGAVASIAGPVALGVLAVGAGALGMKFGGKLTRDSYSPTFYDAAGPIIPPAEEPKSVPVPESTPAPAPTTTPTDTLATPEPSDVPAPADEHDLVTA
jgi:hypothetical protein